MHWGWLLAHAFGQVYNLPVPLWLYLYGGGAAVILSFVVVGFVVDRPASAKAVVSGRKLGTLSDWVLWLVRLLSLALFVAIILAGWYGTQDSNGNIAVTFVWITFYLGFAYLCLLLGDLWQLVHPVRTVISLASKLKPLVAYPRWLGSWPALITYVVFIWLETLSNGYAIIPANLSRLLVAYFVLTLGGVVAFGEDWYAHGDFLSVFFHFFGSLSPISHENKKIILRSPLSGLLSESVADLGRLVFILFMLASTAFDGLRDTQSFALFYNWLVGNIPTLVSWGPTKIRLVVLLISPLAFLSIYAVFIRLIKVLVATKQTTKQLMFSFAPSLVPIAIAYNIAHYYTLLLIQGQLIIKLLSDPLGRGWNLFGTANFRINVGLLNAANVWYTQVGLIVLGHIAAVYIAHLIALRVYPKTKQAILSQYPMLVLMVVYTMTSLWIIAQPITK